MVHGGCEYVLESFGFGYRFVIRVGMGLVECLEVIYRVWKKIDYFCLLGDGSYGVETFFYFCFGFIVELSQPYSRYCTDLFSFSMCIRLWRLVH